MNTLKVACITQMQVCKANTKNKPEKLSSIKKKKKKKKKKINGKGIFFIFTNFNCFT